MVKWMQELQNERPHAWEETLTTGINLKGLQQQKQIELEIYKYECRYIIAEQR